MGKRIKDADICVKSDPIRGVTKHRNTHRHEAHIWHRGKQFYLGSYDCQKDAALAYDKMAVYLGKSVDQLNYPADHHHIQCKKTTAATPQQFLAMIRKESCGFARGSSKFRGVSIRGPNRKWEARIGSLLGKSYTYLGTFNNGEDAARAYDVAAVLTRGKRALTNHDIEDYQVLVDCVEGAHEELKLLLQEHFVKGIKIKWGGDHQHDPFFWMRALHELATFNCPMKTLPLSRGCQLKAKRSARFVFCPEGFVALPNSKTSLSSGVGRIPTFSCNHISSFFYVRKEGMLTESEDFTRTHRLRIYPREKQSVFGKKLQCHDLRLENTDSSWSLGPDSGRKASKRKEFQKLIYLDPSAMLKGEQTDPFVHSAAAFLKEGSIHMEQVSNAQGFPSHPAEHSLQQPPGTPSYWCGIPPATGYDPYPLLTTK